MAKREKVLVTGISREAGKAVASYFHHQGIYVLGVDETEDMTAHIDEFHRSFVANSLYYLEQLLLLGEINQVSLLVPTLWNELLEISFNKHSFLRKGIHTYISPSFSIKICQDRSSLFRFLRKRGIHTADSASLFDDEQYDSLLINKENISSLQFRPLKGRIYQANPIKSHEQLKRFHHNQFDKYLNVNLCIDGKEPHKVLAAQTLEVSTTKDAELVKKVQQPELEELSSEIARELGLIGVINISAKRTADGEVVLLSVEPKVGRLASHAPEVFDALCWMWFKDIGKTTDFFIPGLPANWSQQ